MLSIEDARGLLGEHIALLHDYAGGDPGWKNVLAARVRAAADAYALAVLEETIAHEALRDCGHAEGGAECFAWLRARIEAAGQVMAEEQGERKQWAAVEAAFKVAFRTGEDFYLLQREATGEVVAKSESRLKDALRDLALAVAREIFKEHHPRLCGIWAAAYNDMLIEDIERLGYNESDPPTQDR